MRAAAPAETWAPGDALISPRASPERWDDAQGHVVRRPAGAPHGAHRQRRAIALLNSSSTYATSGQGLVSDSARPCSDSLAPATASCRRHAGRPIKACRRAAHTLAVHGQASQDVDHHAGYERRAPRPPRTIDGLQRGAARRSVCARPCAHEWMVAGPWRIPRRVGPAGERRPAPRRARVGAALQLPARQRLDGRAEDRGARLRTDRPARRRHARARPPVPRAADRGAAPARGHPREGQPQELDRAPGRVHARAHRPQPPLRRDRRRLPRQALPGGRPAHVRDPRRRPGWRSTRCA